MSIPWILFLTILVSSTALASAAPTESVLIEADEAFNRQTGEEGLTGWLAWFAPDAAVFPAVGPVVRGVQAIAAYYRGLDGFPPPGFRWQPERGAMAASDDLGWTEGCWEIEGAEGSDGRYLSIWGLQDDGNWKVVADSGGQPDYRASGGLVGATVPAPEERGADLVTFASAAGDMVVRGGQWETGTEAGDQARGKALVVWKRLPDNSWEIATEIGFQEWPETSTRE